MVQDRKTKSLLYILLKIWPTNRFLKKKSYNFQFHENDVTWPLSAHGLLIEGLRKSLGEATIALFLQNFDKIATATWNWCKLFHLSTNTCNDFVDLMIFFFHSFKILRQNLLLVKVTKRSRKMKPNIGWKHVTCESHEFKLQIEAQNRIYLVKLIRLLLFLLFIPSIQAVF